MALVGRDEAEDLLARLFLKASERPPRTATNIRGWLARVLKNEAVDSLRSKQRRQAREQRLPKPENPFTPHELLEKSEAQNLIHQALQELDEPNRLLLLMRYFQQLSPQEIAQNLNVSIPTVRVRLTRALGALRNRLRTKYGDQGIGYCFIATGQYSKATVSTLPLSLGALSFYGAVALLLVLTAAILWAFDSPRVSASDLLVEGKVTAFGFATVPDKGEISILAEGRTEKISSKGEGIEFEILRLAGPKGNAPDVQNAYIFSNGEMTVGKRIGDGELSFPRGYLTGLPDEAAHRLILIESSDQAPWFGPLPSVKDGSAFIQLPEGDVFSGVLSFGGVKPTRQLNFQLGLMDFRPNPDSDIFHWRMGLSDRHKEIFDRAYFCINGKVQPDGGLLVEGLPVGWNGVFRFMSNRYWLADSHLVAGFCVTKMPVNSVDIKLALIAKPVQKGRFFMQDGTQLADEFSVDGFCPESANPQDQGIVESFGEGNFEIILVQKKSLVGYLNVSEGIWNGNISLPDSISEGELINIEVPPVRTIEASIVDESGSPVPGAFIQTISGSMANPMTEDSGIFRLDLPGFVRSVVIGAPGWRSRKIPVSEFEGSLILVPDFRLRMNFHNPMSEDFDIGKRRSFGIVSLSCPEGLFENTMLPSNYARLSREWEIERDKDSGRIIQIVQSLQFHSPLDVYDLAPRGEIDLKIQANSGLVIEKRVSFSARNGLHEWEFDVPVKPAVSINGRVVSEDGSPASYAEVCCEYPNVYWSIVHADGYGYFSIVGNGELEGEIRLTARLPMHRPSEVISIEIGKKVENLVLELRPSRQIRIDSIELEKLGLLENLSCRVSGPLNQFSYHAIQLDPPHFILEAAPVEDFEVEFSGLDWKLYVICREGLSEFYPHVPRMIGTYLYPAALSLPLGVQVVISSESDIEGWAFERTVTIESLEEAIYVEVPLDRDKILIDMVYPPDERGESQSITIDAGVEHGQWVLVR
jgi:RNA polymerase sigma-70 factor, ECF subfamily